MKPKKTVKAYKHKSVTRAHIPSAEEAGYEAASPKVTTAPEQHPFPRNPIVHRGQDPELFWMHKYGADDTADRTTVDIRSLYRHEHLAPETLIKGLYRLKADLPTDQGEMFSVNEIFGNAIGHEELDKVSDYYTHSDGWTNRLIQGDSLLVMSSLLEREGMAGQVQCLYFDPPYGIKYGSNWQIKLNNRTVTDGADDSLSGEPEQIKAFRDTWELGIHSYLSYLRDRLLVAKELLHESGSVFVQISDENVHLVRCIADEVFGSGNFCSLITFRKAGHAATNLLGTTHDFILWYARDRERVKFRQLFRYRSAEGELPDSFDYIELPDGSSRRVTPAERLQPSTIPADAKVFQSVSMESLGVTEKGSQPFEYKGRTFRPRSNAHWKTSREGMLQLAEKGRLMIQGESIRYKMFLADFPVLPHTNLWDDVMGAPGMVYVVQTNEQVIQRCILMTTDPGDLVVDPTCGSGTTAYVAEQWGRRWITIDTSRIALNVAKSRLMTATFPSG